MPVPDGVTVHHVWLLEAVQLQLDATEKVVEPAGEFGTARFVGVTESVQGAGAWVTVTTTGVNPDTVTVIFAVLVLVVLFTE